MTKAELINSMRETQEYQKKAIEWLRQHYEILDKEWVELVKLEGSTGVKSERASYLEGHRAGISIGLRFFHGLKIHNEPRENEK